MKMRRMMKRGLRGWKKNVRLEGGLERYEIGGEISFPRRLSFHFHFSQIEN
jgi:hypothetical protein